MNQPANNPHNSIGNSHANNPQSNTTSANNPYADIINHPRPISLKHKPMSRANRAAQFSPYAALVGHKDIVQTVEDATTFDEPEIILDPMQEIGLDPDIFYPDPEDLNDNLVDGSSYED